MQLAPLARRGLVLALMLTGAVAAPAVAEPVDLERVTVAQLQSRMQAGELNSVELTKAYIARIAALNRRGPGLNAVRILNADALTDAALLDHERATGHVRGALHGIPVLVKDNLDVAGLPTTAGAVALEHSIAPTDSTVVARLRSAGAVILGKTNLSEFANFITNSNPSGYSGLGGQVLNALDADQNPSGSSSGSATAAAAALAAVTIGTETSGSIISPSAAQGIVGLRPTVGLVSRYGIVPISASQDTAGPMVRTVADAAAELQAIAGADPLDPPGLPLPPVLPDYLAALDPNALAGERIGVINSGDANYQAAVAAVQALGAVTVTIPTPNAQGVPQVLNYEFKRDLNAYLAHLGPGAPVKSLQEVIAFNDAHPQEAIKFGHTLLTQSQAIDISPGSAETATYNTNLANGKAANRAAIDNALTTNDLGAIMTPSGTLTGIGARAGYPQLTVPAGYAAASRRAVNVSFTGTAYTEAKLLAYGYAYEQATKLRRPASEIVPSLYRCAKTAPPSTFASRGACAPGAELLAQIGSEQDLPFAIETESARSLAARMTAGTLTSLQLTKAYLARIARTNTEGPSLNAVRIVNPKAMDDAAALDAERAAGHVRGPLHGLPVLVKDNIDLAGLPTTAGSVALQRSVPDEDSTLARRLRAAGAVILGKTNLTEFANFLTNGDARRLLVARRPGPQPVRRRRQPERLVGGFGLGRRGRPRGADRRHGDVGLDHQPVGRQRDRRPAADARAREPHGHPADRGVAGHRRTDDARRLRRGDGAAGDRRPGPRRRRHRHTAADAARLRRRLVRDRVEREAARRDRQHERAQLRGRRGGDPEARGGDGHDHAADGDKRPVGARLRVQARPQRVPGAAA